ncbi:MAG: serine hydrolase domain-containing protein [Kofleriaceae bacterium]
MPPRAAEPPADPALAARLEAIAKTHGLRGVILVGRGDQIRYAGVVGPSRPDAAPLTRAARWRWASVTKQLAATMVLQEVDAGRIELDQPIARYLPQFASPNAATLTVRQLLRHQSGLPDPDETPAGADGVAAYYAPTSPPDDPLTGYCAGPPLGPPGEGWRYNNCDYLVVGTLLEAVTGQPFPGLVRARLHDALGLASVAVTPLADTVPGYVGGAREPAIALERYGGAGAVSGTIDDLWQFDRALLDGRLVSPAARAEMWDGQAALGYIALGQWAFPAPLAGCAEPVQVVERRGGIGGVQVRNFIVPALDAAVIVFTDDGDLDFGELWTGGGVGHDLLAAVACPPAP